MSMIKVSCFMKMWTTAIALTLMADITRSGDRYKRDEILWMMM